jgi:hypothetical protein
MKTSGSRSSRYRLWASGGRLATVTILCTSLAAVSAGSAQAAGPYSLIASFGSARLSSPIGVAVDQSNGDLYVANLESKGVAKFDGTGTYLSPPSPFDTEGGSAVLAGAAVDPAINPQNGAAGDVYVLDAFHQEIQTFDSSGGSVGTPFSVAGSANFFGTTVVQIATDSAGDVYFPNPPAGQVQEFGPDGSGTAINTFTGSGTVGAFNAPTGVAVDSAGNVYVADTGNGRVVRIEAGTGAQSVLDAGGSESVSSDPSNGDVFVGDYNSNDSCGSLPSPCFHVVRYAASGGAPIGDFGAGQIGSSPFGPLEPDELAVDHATHNVFVTDVGGNEVREFSQVIPPSVTTGSATAVTATEATLNGSVNPHGNETSYHFEYVDAAHYDPTAADPYRIPEGSPASVGGVAPIPDANVGSGVTNIAVSQPIHGLEGNTTYHFRLVATTSGGVSVDGEDQTLTTAAVPAVITAPAAFASNLTQTDATLNATINPQHLDTTYFFNYGRSSSYGVSAPATPVDMGAGTTPESVSLDLATAAVVLHPGTGSRALEPNTVYHFQVVAHNNAGATEGPDETFITLPPAPTATTGAASEVSQTTATLSGTVDPGSAGPNSDTIWYFQYGTDGTYGSGSVPLPPGDAGMGPSAVAVSAGLRGLATNTAYHYRLVAVNDNTNPVGAAQSADGIDHTFTTLPAEPLIGRPSAVGTSAATLNGRVDPTGSDLLYRFQYGTSTTYGQATDLSDAGASTAAVAVSATLSGLTPGATYHARLVATNAAGGESYSEGSAFTLAAPAPAVGVNEFGLGAGTSSPPAELPLLGIPTFPSLNGGVPTTPVQSHPLTGAQQLAKALKACRHEPRKKRARCKAVARRRYGRRSRGRTSTVGQGGGRA